jgi:hypothetical protein
MQSSAPRPNLGEWFNELHDKGVNTDGEGPDTRFVDGERRALFVLLDARGIALDDEQRAQVEACADAALLQTWVARAAVAETAAEVLAR